MDDFEKQTQSAIELLRDPKSSKRRSGAKALRRLRAASAGPVLFATLREEVRDPRTWETQYQMVMAIAESGFHESVPFLQHLATQNVETMVLVAIGDALIRLGRQSNNDPAPILNMIRAGHPAVVEGGLRAIAMLKLDLNREAVGSIIEYVSSPERQGARFWAAAAAAGWSGPQVEGFLTTCLRDELADTRLAAAHALEGHYLKWNPL